MSSRSRLRERSSQATSRSGKSLRLAELRSSLSAPWETGPRAQVTTCPAGTAATVKLTVPVLLAPTPPAPPPPASLAHSVTLKLASAPSSTLSPSSEKTSGPPMNPPQFPLKTLNLTFLLKPRQTDLSPKPRFLAQKMGQAERR